MYLAWVNLLVLLFAHVILLNMLMLCLKIFNVFFSMALDDVIVTGILSAKWSSDLKDVRCDLDPILLANFVR